MSNQDFDVYLARASNLSQRYRDEATDKPSQAIDSLILTASRRAPVPAATLHPQSWFRRWRVPLSVAAVMMLGVGVTLRTVMEENKASAPPPLAAPPAPSQPIENKTNIESPPGAMMGGAASSSSATPTVADIADEKKEAEAVVEKEILMDVPATSAQPAAPPELPRDKATQTMPSPESSVGAAPRPDALEGKAGSGSRADDLGKSKSPPLQEQDAMLSPPKRDQDGLARQREPAKPNASVETEARVVPGIAAPAVEEVPQAVPNDGPRFPEGHSPIVDGKTFRSEKNLTESGALEKKQSARAESYEDSAEAWLRHVAELRRLDRNVEANKELERFRKRYPDYPAPTEQ